MSQSSDKFTRRLDDDDDDDDDDDEYDDEESIPSKVNCFSIYYIKVIIAIFTNICCYILFFQRSKPSLFELTDHIHPSSATSSLGIYS